MSLLQRWFVPAVLCFLLWAFLAGTWMHDWRIMAGSVVAFWGVVFVELEAFESRAKPSVERQR